MGHDDQLEGARIVVIRGKMIVDVAQLLGEARMVAEIAMVQAAELRLQLQVTQLHLGRQRASDIGCADGGSSRHQRPHDTASVNFFHRSSPLLMRHCPAKRRSLASASDALSSNARWYQRFASAGSGLTPRTFQRASSFGSCVSATFIAAMASPRSAARM